MPENHEDIRQLFVQIERLKLQSERLVSNAESEKGTVKRMHELIFKEIKSVENELKDILYGKDRQSGIIVELDRLKQESMERKKTRQNIFALWIAFGALLIKEVITYFIGSK